MGLQQLVGRQPGNVQGFPQALGRKIRRPDYTNLAVTQELLVGAQRLLHAQRGIVPMREVDVDVIGTQSLQGVLHRLQYVCGGQALLRRPHLPAHLCCDQYVVAAPTTGEPVADDGLRLPATVARHPHRIHIGGVDEIAAAGNVGIQHCVGAALIGGPAEHIAAQHEGKNLQARPAKGSTYHHQPSTLAAS